MHFFSLWLKPDEIITLLRKIFSSRETSLAGHCISLLGSRLYNHMTNFFISFLKSPHIFLLTLPFVMNKKISSLLHLEVVTYGRNRRKKIMPEQKKRHLKGHENKDESMPHTSSRKIATKSRHKTDLELSFSCGPSSL